MSGKRLPRPYCRGIEPEGDSGGYYCQRCGYSLHETPSGWWRHGDRWVHPEVWTTSRRSTQAGR